MRRRRGGRINDDGTIRCRKCGEFKDSSLFYRAGEGFRSTCKDCEASGRGQMSKSQYDLWVRAHGPVPSDKMLIMGTSGYPILKDRSWNYIKITVDGKRVYLHRYVWEEANGPIPEGYVVHHKDGNIYNNALWNLELMLKEEHDLHHQNDEERRESKREVARKVGLGNRKVGPEGTSWCSGHQAFLPVECFTKSKNSWNGLDRRCKECKKLNRRVEGEVR